MKLLTTTLVAAVLLVGTYQASAQSSTVPLNEPDYNQPKIFTDLPQQMDLRIAAIDALFSSTGNTVSAQVSNQFLLKGTVVSHVVTTDVNTVVIRSNARGGAAFTFTKRTATDGSVIYSGRMFSRSAGDALEIIKEGSAYIIKKKSLYDIINE